MSENPFSCRNLDSSITSTLRELERARTPGPLPEVIDGMRLGPELGRGAMAVVYKATDRAGRDVALKLALAPSRSVAIEREERALALAGSYPNLVRLLGGGRIGQRPYLVLELIDGESLRARSQRGALSVSAVACALAPVARALTRLHARGVLHRDVKPANVVVGRDGRGTLIDLGLARLPGSVEQAGSTVGTPAYMAPEQLLGGDRVGPPADVFGLGMMLYELLIGQLPQAAGNMSDLTRLRLSEPISPPARQGTDLPRELAGLVHRCLAPDPEARPAPSVLALALDAFTTGPSRVEGPPAKAA